MLGCDTPKLPKSENQKSKQNSAMVWNVILNVERCTTIFVMCEYTFCHKNHVKKNAIEIVWFFLPLHSHVTAKGTESDGKWTEEKVCV